MDLDLRNPVRIPTREFVDADDQLDQAVLAGQRRSIPRVGEKNDGFFGIDDERVGLRFCACEPRMQQIELLVAEVISRTQAEKLYAPFK